MIWTFKQERNCCTISVCYSGCEMTPRRDSFARRQPPIQPVLDASFLLMQRSGTHALCVKLTGSHLPVLPVLLRAYCIVYGGKNQAEINIFLCAYRLYAVERKIDTKVRNIGQQKCYNDLRKRRRSLAWHEQRASRLKNFALVSARKRAAGRNYSGFGFQTALSARNAAVRNITQFAGGTRSSAVPADTRLPSPQKPLCTARICP